MRVVPFLLAGNEGLSRLLFDEAAPRLVPDCKCGSKRSFVCLGECEHECAQLSTRISFGTAGEILRHLFDLVELTHLYGNILEDVEETAPAVYDRCKECPTPLFQYVAPIVIVRHALSLNLLPPDVLLEIMGAEYTYAIAPTPERSVGDEDG